MQADSSRSPRCAVWGTAAAGAALLVLAGLLPGFEASYGSYIITGSTERFLPPVQRTYTLLGYGHPRYLAALAGALVVIAAAAWGWRRPAASVPLAAILAAAIGGLALTSAVLRESNGVSGGVFLRGAHDAMLEEVRNSREARHPQFVANPFGASPAIGWWITQGVLWALLSIASVGLGRRLRRIGWLVLGYVVLAILLVVLAPGPTCDGVTDPRRGPDPDSNPIALLAVLGGAACAGVGIGALSRRAWKRGAFVLVVGFAGALVALFFLIAKDCGLDAG